MLGFRNAGYKTVFYLEQLSRGEVAPAVFQLLPFLRPLTPARERMELRLHPRVFIRTEGGALSLSALEQFQGPRRAQL